MSLATSAPVDPGPADAVADTGVRVRRASAWWVLTAGVIGLLAAADLLV